jgi:retron-type reverse transcriptase
MGSSSDIDISIASLWRAWQLFSKGRRCSRAIDEYEYNLEAELLRLHYDLSMGKYVHGEYAHFTVNDSKRREIAVATVRDRVVHRLLYEYLVPIVDKQFSYHVWSCRQNKGLVGANEATARNMARYRNGWLWRGDIRKFFDSVDHKVLLEIIHKRVPGEQSYTLCQEIIRSYETTKGRGIAIGNLTSQILANVYLNEFDRFVLHALKPLAYIRYGDDFILWCDTKEQALLSAERGKAFLHTSLNLEMQPANTLIQRTDRKLHYLGIEFFSFGHRLDTRNRQKLERKITMKNQASFRGLAVRHMPKGYRSAFAWRCLAYYDSLFDE